MLMNLGNYFLDLKVSSMFSLREPLSSPKGVSAEPRRSWPLAWRKRQPLAAVCPFALFHPLWLCFLLQEEAGFARWFYRVLCCAGGFEAEACSLGPPPCTAAIPHPDAAVMLLPQGQVLGWSSSKAGRQPSPAVHCDLGPRILCKHTLLKSPCSALPPLQAM